MHSTPLDCVIVLFLFFVDSTCCQDVSSTVAPKSEVPLIETNIFGFRLWMIMGLVLTGLLVIIIVLCCIFDCRIPRTKQEIEKDFERRLLAKKMSKHMDTIKPGQNIRITKLPDKRMLQYAKQAKLIASTLSAMKTAARSAADHTEDKLPDLQLPSATNDGNDDVAL